MDNETNAFPVLASIRARRKRLGISQSEFSRLTGISQSMLTRIERGSVMPGYNKAVGIFERLTELEHKDQKVASDIMNRDLIILKGSDTVGKVMRLAKEHSISQFPVMDGANIVGSIRLVDIMGLSMDSRIGWRLNPPFAMINESTPSSIVRELLKHDREVLVMRKAKPIGIITVDDFL